MDAGPVRWPFVKKAIHREVVGSTNDLARELFVGGEEVPLLVLTDRQTAGRGRGTNTWWSDEGSLTFTVAFDPATCGVRWEQEPRIALVTALAIIEALETMLPAGTLGIRWPNDVEAGGRKLGGILPERIGNRRGMLVGVGLNINTRLEDAPEDICRMATSVALLKAEPVEKSNVLRSVLERFGPWLRALSREDPCLAERWLERDVLLGQAITVDVGGRILTGIGRGINAHGGLCMVHEAEELILYGGRVLRA
jgi:BirA family biotin operon repressor/biotin-[acetyl-CoA-carboxylase] ligase